MGDVEPPLSPCLDGWKWGHQEHTMICGICPATLSVLPPLFGDTE